ncbi:MAG: glutaminyl-peptide cyclotransferase [Erythrobacter sp.]|uniref:glutaminyl-peptide cyclotransferase n=1 Tax=Erythrobacter sp. TaxID=1042 RepID=UPI003C7803C1
MPDVEACLRRPHAFAVTARRIVAVALFGALLAGQAPATPIADAPAQVEAAFPEPIVYEARIVARYPHDTSAYTQGLLWHDGALYESTGKVGRSRIRKIDLATGVVLMERHIPETQFGEGLALCGDDLISLTWRDGVVHRWSLEDLEPLSSFEQFPFEGWGLTTSDEGLIHSDGSSLLRILDPQSYDVRREVEVTIKGRPLRNLNELELIDGLVWANIWQTGYIAAIDPADGTVRKLIDARAIVAEVGPQTADDVLNGIAWDVENRRLFVTGKLWPTLFEIELAETDARVR